MGCLKGSGDFKGVVGGFAGAEMEGFETTVGEEAVKGGGHGADGILEKGEAGVDGRGVKGKATHEDVL